MMQKIVFVFITLLLPFIPKVTSAQQHYKNSAGIRLGHNSAITYKRFFNKEQAMELMIGGRNDGLQLTFLYQFHKPMPIAFNNNFFAYYGVGGHVGYEDRKELLLTDPNDNTAVIERDVTYFTLGIDPVLGVEYRWLAVPVTINVDVKPYFNFIGMRDLETQFWDMALSVKYVF